MGIQVLTVSNASLDQTITQTLMSKIYSSLDLACSHGNTYAAYVTYLP